MQQPMQDISDICDEICESDDNSIGASQFHDNSKSFSIGARNNAF